MKLSSNNPGLDEKDDNMMEHWKMEERAYRRAYEKMVYDAFLRDMEADPKRYFEKGNFTNIENYNMVKALIKERGRSWGYMRVCITLNKENDDVNNVEWFVKKVNKMMNWKWIDVKSSWNFEWRNGVEGMHSHALIKMCKGKRYSQAKKQIINSWKKYGFVKVYPTNDSNNDYIKGIKDKSKMKKVENDDIKRKVFGINKWYVKEKI